MFDLGIEGGIVVSPTSRRRVNVYVRGERVAELTPDRRDARAAVDASGLLVMPGMVDTHVHLMDPAETEREDFPRGTAAAARAGVTTIIEHTHAGPVRTASDLVEKRAYLAGRSRIDFGLAAHAWPERLDDVEELWKAGASFFKVFTCSTHGVPGFDAAQLLALFRLVAALGAVCLVHCEDQSITALAEQRLRASGREDGRIVPEWRSLDAELAALVLTSFLARRTRARVVTAHASCVGSTDVVAREREAGAAVEVETCPQYLTLFEAEAKDLGALRKFTPPARAATGADLADMWHALSDGRIHHVSSDHAPSTLRQKRAGSIWSAPFGLPGLDTTLPVLLDGASGGFLSYERVVEAYSEAPSRMYGLYPRKGHLDVGADADLVLVDPDRRWIVTDTDILSGAGWSPFSGRTLVGGAVATYLRGQLVAERGRVIAEPGHGEFIPGPGAGSPNRLQSG